jgi:hypothetical protein
LTAIGSALTMFFSLVLRPFEHGHAYAGMLFISIATGGVMLLLFKAMSNQEAMKAVKAKIGAYFLEMRLYKDDASTVMASQRRVLRANLGYMRYAVLPALVMMVPVLLIMIQLNLRYAHTALKPGEVVTVKVMLPAGADVMSERLTLTPASGIEKASPAVRIPALGEVDWKIRLTAPGPQSLTLASNAAEMTLPVSGVSTISPVYADFKQASFWDGLVNPGAPAIPATMPVRSVEIKYPERTFNFGLFRLSWLWTFLVISMAFGVVLKFIFKVE